tara:strand:- start:572 stop:850 length:279 start_codon:yes stop_codon:yes gene_type:complete
MVGVAAMRAGDDVTILTCRTSADSYRLLALRCVNEPRDQALATAPDSLQVKLSNQDHLVEELEELASRYSGTGRIRHREILRSRSESLRRST